MQINHSTALVTGANRGIGHALVEALLARGVAKVYAAARDTGQLADFGDARVTPLKLDVTDAASIAAAADAAPDVTLLINNAGALEGGTVLETTAESLDRQFAVNVHGPLLVAQAFVPALRRAAAPTAIVNLLSVVSLAPMAGLAGYSASKAAAASLTGSLRTALRADGIAVHGVFPGPVDTRMADGVAMEKTPPLVVAQAILDGVEAGDADIFPDAMAQSVGAGWASDPRGVAAQFAAF